MRTAADYIGKPIRSMQTMLRTLSKTRSNQPSVIPDGIFGTDTTRALSAFQWQEGLPSTGVVDNDTWDTLIEAYINEAPLVLSAAPLEIIWNPLDKIKQGERSRHLYLIQAMLVVIGKEYPLMPQVEITGVNDAPTVESIKWLQVKSGRPSTGIIDQLDWLFLTKLYRLTAGDGKTDYTRRTEHSD